MRSKLFPLALLPLLLILKLDAKAQYYCFWVANQTTITFDALKIRVHGSGDSFGPDLLPTDYISPGHHFWVRTPNNGLQTYDVQLTKKDGSPLLFTYTDNGGMRHIDQRFITVNAHELHTLVIQESNLGDLSFLYYTTDQLDYGDPCNH